MNPPAKRWLKRAAFVAFVATAVYFFLPQMLAALRAGVGAVLYVLVSLLGICILPFVAMWLFGFVFWFVKPYVRAWHIRHIRNSRLLKEAANRGRLQS